MNQRPFNIDSSEAPNRQEPLSADEPQTLGSQKYGPPHGSFGETSSAEVAADSAPVEANITARGTQPFRNVVKTRLGASRQAGRQAHEAFFREMLGDISEITVHDGNPRNAEADFELEAGLSCRIREHAWRMEVSVASFCHLAWALVLARLSGRDDVVFGTSLSGQGHSGEGIGHVMGHCGNTLPFRVRVGKQSVLDSVHNAQILLTGLQLHSSAPLALAQRCSALPEAPPSSAPC
jgi:arthrofactin-type cyclic lipopeptide synthetase C